jgi:hypothetical protein
MVTIHHQLSKMKKLLLFIILFWALQFSLFAQIARVGSGTVGAGELGNVSHSYTIAAGSLRILWVGCIGDNIGGFDDVDPPTYAGDTATLAAKLTTGFNRFGYLFYFINPVVGTDTISVASVHSHSLYCVAADYTGAKQTGQPDATTTNVSAGSSDTSLTTSITVVAANSWIILLEQSFESGAVCPTAGSGLTLLICEPTNGEPTLFDSNAAVSTGAHNVTTNSTPAFSTGIAHVVASFAPDTGGGGGTTPNHSLLLGVK